MTNPQEPARTEISRRVARAKRVQMLAGRGSHHAFPRHHTETIKRQTSIIKTATLAMPAGEMKKHDQTFTASATIAGIPVNRYVSMIMRTAAKGRLVLLPPMTTMIVKVGVTTEVKWSIVCMNSG